MIYFKTNRQNFFVLVYFVCHTPQFKTLVFSFRSESWIVQNFDFTVFEDFYLSLSWKYRFLQNVSHAKVQSKTNKYCKFHVDLTRRRLSKSRFKKLGMVLKKLYRNTLKENKPYSAFIKLSCQILLQPAIPSQPVANMTRATASPPRWNVNLLFFTCNNLSVAIIAHLRRGPHSMKFRTATGRLRPDVHTLVL